MSAGPYNIGSTLWPGLSKLAEEAGEAIQVVGKLVATSGEVAHWDGTNLRDRLEEEVADLMAACRFVAEANDLAVDKRVTEKLATFWKWHQEQLGPDHWDGRMSSASQPGPLRRCAECGQIKDYYLEPSGDEIPAGYRICGDCLVAMKKR